MEKRKNLFEKWKSTWPRVLILAVASAVLVAVLKLIPALDGTSFQDPAINVEAWFLFAMLVIIPCENGKEAAIKCFAFFLVSQPLIYLIQVPFADKGWGIFQYYPRWFFITLLTLPGAAIAFLVKKKNWLSVGVLSVATGYLAFQAADYAKGLATGFPRHLLSLIFCVVLALGFIFILLRKKEHRIAALGIFLAALIASMVLMGVGKDHTKTVELDEGNWTVTVEDEAVLEASLEDKTTATLKPMGNGSTYVVFTDENGTVLTYYATVSGGEIWLDLLES